jgi:hypothetical protein
LHNFSEIGSDEIHLIPTSSDIDQLRRIADVARQSLSGELRSVKFFSPPQSSTHYGIGSPS